MKFSAKIGIRVDKAKRIYEIISSFTLPCFSLYGGGDFIYLQ